ncbi:response regulator [Shimia sp. R10_1]|uniref:PAS domain-containing hybrid sensor histidine kinase/response regulator n=1 Tax=Shimia sp. R10_1 TaxID=2821095 RepID=UPI001AD9AB63|nr:PAS domain-containing hybrid sensor histidine kinase/response regulator [Shimia sp. R10_1]MBO9473117.1 response regulator [Shimia sp. R10_1]
MSAGIRELRQALANFDRSNTRSGRLARYARGRRRHFVNRQLIVAIGAVMLMMASSIEVGLLAFSAALIGEVVDLMLLRRVSARLKAGTSPDTIFFQTSLSALFQACGLSVFVSVMWFNIPGEAGLLVCISYFIAGAINAIMSLAFHRTASLIRLSVFALALSLLYLANFYLGSHDGTQLLFDMAATGMVVYAMLPFVGYVTKGRFRDLKQKRRQIEQALALAKANASLLAQQRETRRLASIPENAAEGVLMLDKEVRILWANPAFTKRTGYTLDEVLGKRPGEFLYGPESDDTVQKKLSDTVLTGESAQTVNLNYTKSGKPFWVESNAAPVFDEDGQLEVYVSIERDITEQKNYETDMAEAKRAAEIGEKAKTIFLANMSHEIRTPMNGIIGMADLLADSDLGPEDALYVQTIRHSSEALLTIINDILDYSKLQDGSVTINPTRFELPTFIQEISTLLGPQAGAKDLALNVNIQEGLPQYLLGDHGRLRQILLNVIGNAIKFTEFGSVDVDVACREGGGGLTIQVRDTGMGISSDRLSHIFEQFEQADAETTRQFGGTGLGLAISRQLARMMGGDVTATSTLGLGSCFTIDVNILKARPPEQGKTCAQNLPDETVFKGVTLLLAEDNRTNQLLIKKMLKSLPIRLVIAEDGSEAVAKTICEEPDVVLMDMSMPVMDGLDATREIRRLSIPQPKIIAITANAYRSDKEACMQAGMDSFLSKPLRRAELLETLASVLETRDAEPLEV